MDYKKILMRVTIVFAGVVLFLTFFSRTLGDLHIPRVTLDFAEQGIINPEARSTGIVTAADTEQVFAPVSGRITQIALPGEVITAQTVLFTITSDLRSLSEMLENAEHDRRVAALNIERTQSEISSEQAQLAQAAAPVLNLFEYDFQLENNDRALILQLEVNDNATEAAKDELEVLQILYGQGIIPRQQLIDGENEISRLAQAREQIIAQHEQSRAEISSRREQAISNHEAATAAHRETVQAAHGNRIAQLEFTLTAHRMELERIEARIYGLARQIADGGIAEVRLESGGARTVMELMPNIAAGSVVSEGAAVMLTALNNNRFYIEASFPQAQDFIDINQSAEILVGTERLTGTTARIVPQGGRNTVTIEVSSGALRGGEMVSVIISGGSSNHASIIPLSALREDTSGYFILYAVSVPQRFSSNYYARVRRVETGRRDASNVAISPVWGMDIPEEPIIINSDIPVHAGARVRIVGDVPPAR